MFAPVQKSEGTRNVGAFAQQGKAMPFFQAKLTPVLDSGKQIIQRQETTTAPTALSCPEGSRDVPRATTTGDNAVDSRGQSIIDLAQDTTITEAVRAVRVGTGIICTYFPSLVGLVSAVEFDTRADETGLDTTSVGSGATTRGRIKVSARYVTDLPRFFARKVLQMRHELQHIEQYRSGMSGGSRQDEREFLAFYEAALAVELEGTGRMQNPTRLIQIDAAIGYYLCLSTALQTQYATQYSNLTTRRAALPPRRDRSPYPAAPTACTRQRA